MRSAVVNELHGVNPVQQDRRGRLGREGEKIIGSGPCEIGLAVTSVPVKQKKTNGFTG